MATAGASPAAGWRLPPEVIGTIAGSLAAVALSVVLPPPLVAAAVLVAVVLFLGYSLAGDARWKVAWMTVLTVLLLGSLAGAGTIEIAAQRLAWTIVGAGLVVVAGLAVAALDRHVGVATAAVPG